MQITNYNPSCSAVKNSEIHFGKMMKMPRAQRIINDAALLCFDKNLTESDLQLFQGIDYAVQCFRHKKHVNTCMYGCSDGKKPYLALMYLYSKYGEKTASKFMPIIAKDCDETAVLAAKTGVLKLTPAEFNKIQKYTGSRADDFFNGENLYDSVQNGACMQTNPKYYSKILFSKGNILTDCKNIKPRNTFLITGNFISDMSSAERDSVSKHIANHLKPGSIWSLRSRNGFVSREVLGHVVSQGFTNEGCPAGLYQKKILNVSAKEIYDYIAEKVSQKLSDYFFGF